MFPKFSYIKQEARHGLRCVWFRSFWREFVHALIAGESTPAGLVTLLIYILLSLVTPLLMPEQNTEVLHIGVIFLLLLFAIELLRLLLGCGIRISIDRYYLSLAEFPEEDPHEPLFSKMRYFANRFFVELQRDIGVALLSLLFVIPGIIHGLKWSMANYILAENPTMDSMDALTESSLMMDGYKMKFFLFNLSFLPLFFLCVITCGIGLIWAVPYYNAARAKFYYYIKNPTWKESNSENEMATLNVEKFSYDDFVDEYESKLGKN